MNRRGNLITRLIGSVADLIGVEPRAAVARPATPAAWSPAAALAAERPPSSLSAFALSTRPPSGRRASDSVSFDVACRTCAGAHFRVFAFPLIAPDPSPYYGLEPGDTFNRPPHRLACEGCGEIHTLFDIRTDGYDGVLNGGGATESGDSGEAPIVGASAVTITLIYNIELDELQEYASEEGRHPSDLFDAFVLYALPLDGSPPLELVYECA